MATALLDLEFRDSAQVYSWSTSQRPELYDITKWTPRQLEVLRLITKYVLCHSFLLILVHSDAMLCGQRSLQIALQISFKYACKWMLFQPRRG